jgi:hypothetical protein
MSIIEHITISELQTILKDLDLPLNTRVTISFEDTNTALEILRRKKAIDAMTKLKGSGTGNLYCARLKT